MVAEGVRIISQYVVVLECRENPRMYALADLFDHRFVGHLANHLVSKLKRVRDVAIDPDQQLGPIERCKAIPEGIFGQL